MIPIISVVGQTDCGKTTLIEKLIPELTKRGYRVGTIKHDVHGFEIDVPQKDSWRHREAGAMAVAISSPDKVALIKKVAQELTLDQLVNQYLTDVDIILTEGFKKENKLKIEILRSGVSSRLLSKPEELLLIASDEPGKFSEAPCFGLDDAAGMVDLMEEKILSDARTTKEKKDDIQLIIDGQDISLNEFARLIITNSVLGMVFSLKGVESPKEIILKILRHNS